MECLSQGLEIVFRVGLAILQLNQAELIQLDMEGMLQVWLSSRNHYNYNPVRVNAHNYPFNSNFFHPRGAIIAGRHKMHSLVPDLFVLFVILARRHKLIWDQATAAKKKKHKSEHSHRWNTHCVYRSPLWWPLGLSGRSSLWLESLWQWSRPCRWDIAEERDHQVMSTLDTHSIQLIIKTALWKIWLISLK